MEALEFANLQIAALKKELANKNRELEENNALLDHYERQLNIQAVPPTAKRIPDRYPACYEPLPNQKVS